MVPPISLTLGQLLEPLGECVGGADVSVFLGHVEQVDLVYEGASVVNGVVGHGDATVV